MVVVLRSSMLLLVRRRLGLGLGGATDLLAVDMVDVD